MSNLPAETIRDGAIKATIWANSGEKGTFYSVEIARTYKDANDQYQDATSFTGTDLLKVSRLAGRAYDRVRELNSEQQREAA